MAGGTSSARGQSAAQRAARRRRDSTGGASLRGDSLPLSSQLRHWFERSAERSLELLLSGNECVALNPCAGGGYEVVSSLGARSPIMNDRSFIVSHRVSPCDTPAPSSSSTRSAVARLPFASGPANGHPPQPPTEESMCAMPRSTPTAQFSTACHIRNVPYRNVALPPAMPAKRRNSGLRVARALRSHALRRFSNPRTPRQQ